MFANIRECLYNLECAIKKENTPHTKLTEEEYNYICNFDLHFAESLIRDNCKDSCKRIAKIILATLGE